MIQINGKISCVHGLEEILWLKCPYYPKQSTDLMKCLSKIVMTFSTEMRLPLVLRTAFQCELYLNN